MGKKFTAISILLIIAAIIAYAWLPISESDMQVASSTGNEQETVPAEEPELVEEENPSSPSIAEIKDNENPLPDDFLVSRDLILAQLDEANNCDENGLCLANEDDPRSAMFSREKLLVEALDKLLQHYQTFQQEDEILHATIQTFLDSPLGRVQFKAIEMMQAFDPDDTSATVLIDSLDDSYDSKVMELALTELQRYPHLSADIDELLMSNLKTGSFYVSRTIASEIVPFLNSNNIDSYVALSEALPPKAAKTRLLQSSIDEYKQIVSTQ